MRLASLLLSLCAASAFAAEVKRPNIVFCFADDWGRYASCYAKVDGRPGINDVIRTPNIDRIAGEGVMFRNAFVTAPSCTPCRSSLLSGQYFFRTHMGAILNGAKWDASIPTYPLMLRDVGYHIGKSHKAVQQVIAICPLPRHMQAKVDLGGRKLSYHSPPRLSVSGGPRLLRRERHPALFPAWRGCGRRLCPAG